MNLLIYNILLGIMAEENVCPICFEDDSVDYFLPCAHRFHVNCINPWLNDGNNRCPVCRTYIFATAPGEPPYPGLNVNPNAIIANLANDDALISIVNYTFNSNIVGEITDILNNINLNINNNEIRNRNNELRIFYNDNNIIDGQPDEQHDNPHAPNDSYDIIIGNPPYRLPNDQLDNQSNNPPGIINDPHAPDDSDDPEIPM